MRSLLVAILALTSLSVSSISLAQAPDSLSFQGMLTDTNGVPVADGTHNLLAKMYKGSSKIWEQNHVGVTTKSGIFNIILTGTVTYPLDTVAFNAPIDLGIAVDGGDELAPRTPLTSAAYALGLRGLSVVHAEDASNRIAPNLIGGASNNYVAPDIVGATIGGGGGVDDGAPVPDSVLGRWGTVGGGQANLVSTSYGTVSGGGLNQAGERSVVGGGVINKATGIWATIPGGRENAARGNASFAAGYKARANHHGTFVWNDRSILSNNDSLLSTGPNQFLIRAAGGVGIGTNQPLSDSQLHVEHGSVGTNDWGFVLTNSTISIHRTGMRLSDDGFFEITNDADNSGPGFARLDSGGNWHVVSDRRLKTGIEPASDLLAAALALEPVRYHLDNQNELDGKSLGLVAQQVQDVVPSLVAHGEPLTLNYAGLSVVAIGAIQGLYEIVQEQRVLLAGLQSEIEELRTGSR